MIGIANRKLAVERQVGQEEGSKGVEKSFPPIVQIDFGPFNWGNIENFKKVERSGNNFGLSAVEEVEWIALRFL
ncbi:hypothetical protein HMPREF3158_07450 [Corynebacterium sp. HMSC06G04]|nr:hypothetical protein HMPREF2935_01325 [Corynebacterium sp. HMSC076D02]OFR40162.1 hypothetical protein HMPREF2888_07140 [Corynebacterium sp. HMSC077D03]OFT46384.1 hypothetical protein HMPREF3158_07450 [Corynebacterium sp. HMSC06G04]